MKKKKKMIYKKRLVIIFIFVIFLMILTFTFNNKVGYDYCFVTVLYDLDRLHWEQYSRSDHTYFKNFAELLKMKIPLIIFIQSKYYNRLMRIVKNRR